MSKALLLRFAMPLVGVLAQGACGEEPYADAGATADANNDRVAFDTLTDVGLEGADATDVGNRLDGNADRRVDIAAPRDAVDDRPTEVRRGEYLVKHVAICGDCHTPRMADGTADPSRFLSGASGMFHVPGVAVDGGMGVVSPGNLTPDRDTGLGAWSDADIKRAFLDGVDKDNHALFPIMPYYVLHNMSADDADAIVAYLRSIPSVNNAVPPRNFPVSMPASPLPADLIPNPTLDVDDPDYASAMRGRYLAGNIGLCMDCHTEHTTDSIPLDRDKLFAGGREFAAAELGIPTPPFPSVVYSTNITPHPAGLAGWTARAVAALLKQGIDEDGVRVCPPMPVGPMGSFGGLTDKDARDIGTYIVHLSPLSNVIVEICHDEIHRDGGW